MTCTSSKDELFAIASGLEPGALVKLLANSHPLEMFEPLVGTTCSP